MIGINPYPADGPKGPTASPEFHYTLSEPEKISSFGNGVALLLGFGAFLHGRSAHGEGLFRLFGFIQNQEQPAGLPA
jgi:hypothetical protein